MANSTNYLRANSEQWIGWFVALFINTDYASGRYIRIVISSISFISF